MEVIFSRNRSAQAPSTQLCTSSTHLCIQVASTPLLLLEQPNLTQKRTTSEVLKCANNYAMRDIVKK
jgi:hypothetical protein